MQRGATRDDDGVAMPEMALMAAFIVMAIVTVIRLMMLRRDSSLSDVRRMAGPMGNGGGRRY